MRGKTQTRRMIDAALDECMAIRNVRFLTLQMADSLVESSRRLACAALKMRELIAKKERRHGL